ncbi:MULTISPECIES: hypothetical protein [Nonomuraea]|uniref:Uncharacterized protein n=1 Tax=Nonomuraea mangrovi TaxID=2316207 RepID=A0ABW4SWX0_9ACTN
MGSARAQGYEAVFSGLRTRSSQADYTVNFLWGLRDRLNATFYQEGNPLGNDQYGAELEKNRYTIEDAVFGAFDNYIREMEDLRDGLRGNTRNYQDAEGYGDSGYGDSGYGDPGYGDSGYGDSGYGDPGYENPGGYGGTQDLPDVSLDNLGSANGDPAPPQGW